MAMTSGRSGNLSLGGSVISSLADWTVNWTAENRAQAASNTGGAMAVLPGVRDWTGTANVYDRTAQVVPGAALAFIGWNGATRDTGNIIVTAMSIECDIEGGNWLKGGIEFAGNGAFTPGAAGAALTDSSAPRAYSSLGCKATWQPVVGGVVGSEADIPGVTGWTLKITASVKDAVTATTAPWKARQAGSAVLTAIATVRFKDSAHAAWTTAGTEMAPGGYGKLGLYVDATNKWVFDQFCIGGMNGIGAKVETGDYEQVAMEGQWSSYSNVSGTMTVGTILKPGGTALWP